MSRVVRFHHPVLIDLMREMNNPIKFSVTVPAYKAQFLKECIDSILAQTYQNFELIIVNDASPQDLDSIVAQYQDSRIRYCKNKVGFGAEYVVGNWNKCLEYATGDYLICMGDDDRLLPNCLEEYIKLIIKYPGLGIYHGWTEVINEDGEVINLFPPLPERESIYSAIYCRLSGRAQFIGDCLYDIKLLRENGGFFDLPFAWGSDDISSYIAARKYGIAHTQVPVFQYRQNSQSISSSSHNREKMDALYRELIWVKNFLNEVPITNDRTALTYRKVCLDHLSIFLIEQAQYNMLLDMKMSGRFSAMRYWHRHSIKYHISCKMILTDFIKSFA